MSTLATAWMLGMVTGFFLGVTVAGWARSRPRRGGVIGARPMILGEGHTVLRTPNPPPRNP